MANAAYDVLNLPLRERRRRQAAEADEDTRAQLRALPGRRCSECGTSIRGRPTALTCSQDCSDARTKRRNRERANAWRNRAKQAMSDRLDVFGSDGPPPIQYLSLLAAMPAGSVLTLTLPTGDRLSWSRR